MMEKTDAYHLSYDYGFELFNINNLLSLMLNTVTMLVSLPSDLNGISEWTFNHLILFQW